MILKLILLIQYIHNLAFISGNWKVHLSGGSQPLIPTSKFCLLLANFQRRSNCNGNAKGSSPPASRPTKSITDPANYSSRQLAPSSSVSIQVTIKRPTIIATFSQSK